MLKDGKKSRSLTSNTPFNQPPSDKNVSSGTQFSPYLELHPAELKLSQEWRSWKERNLKKSQCSRLIDPESKFFEVFEVVEEPVKFHFEDDYGTHQFRELKKAFLYEGLNKHPLIGFCEPPVRGLKYSDNEIYNLSSESELMESFYNENLM